MKKIFVLITLIIISFSLSSCKKIDKEIKILMPKGTPELSQMYIESKSQEYNYKIDKVQGADALSAAFLTKSYDIIYAPINLGIKMYINNKNYKMLATVVDCNFYFIYKSTEELTLNELKNKKIVIFGENAISGILARYILGDTNSLDVLYVSSTVDSMSEFIKDNNVLSLVSEPQLSVIETKVDNIKMISVKEEYMKKDDNENNIPQAQVYVRSDLEKEIVDKYLIRLEESIKKVNENINESAKLGNEINNNFSVDVLKKGISRMEIKFTSSKDSKENVYKFIEFLNNYNDKILGGSIDEDFFY